MFLLVILVLLALMTIACLIGGSFKKEFRSAWLWTAAGSFAMFMLCLIFNIWVSISVGHVGIAVWFNNVQKTTYEQGLHLPINPLMDFHEMSVQRQTVEFQAPSKDSKAANTDEIIALSKDNLLLTVEATCPFMLNPAYAWWVYRNIGKDYINGLIKPAARSALRDALAQFSFVAAGTEQREDLQMKMTDFFAKAIFNDLTKLGLDPAEANKIFTIPTVQLRKVLPPEKVQNAISEKLAADQDLQRQHTLTEIAREQANRRKQEGRGIKELFTELPKDFRPNEMARLLEAMATKENADANMKAVESGKVNVLVLGGGAHPSINVPNQ